MKSYDLQWQSCLDHRISATACNAALLCNLSLFVSAQCTAVSGSPRTTMLHCIESEHERSCWTAWTQPHVRLVQGDRSVWIRSPLGSTSARSENARANIVCDPAYEMIPNHLHIRENCNHKQSQFRWQCACLLRVEHCAQEEGDGQLHRPLQDDRRYASGQSSNRLVYSAENGARLRGDGPIKAHQSPKLSIFHQVQRLENQLSSKDAPTEQTNGPTRQTRSSRTLAVGSTSTRTIRSRSRGNWLKANSVVQSMGTTRSRIPSCRRR